MRKAVQSVVERLYYFRSIGKPDSQLVKMLELGHVVIGDQIQREDEINRIVRRKRTEGEYQDERAMAEAQKLLDQQFPAMRLAD